MLQGMINDSSDEMDGVGDGPCWATERGSGVTLMILTWGTFSASRGST